MGDRQFFKLVEVGTGACPADTMDSRSERPHVAEGLKVAGVIHKNNVARLNEIAGCQVDGTGYATRQQNLVCGRLYTNFGEAEADVFA